MRIPNDLGDDNFEYRDYVVCWFYTDPTAQMGFWLALSQRSYPPLMSPIVDSASQDVTAASMMRRIRDVRHV